MEPATNADFVFLQQVQKNMDRLLDRMEKLQESLNDVRERLSNMEGSAINATIARLEGENAQLWEKINALQSDRDQRGGAMKLGEWIYRIGPWIMAAGLIIVNKYS